MWTAYATDVPGDGTCLFHSIGAQLGKNGHYLRNLVAAVIEEHSNSLLHEQKVSDWITWETNKSVEEYVKLLREGLWGGMIDTTILASLFNKVIYVYVPKQNDLCIRIADALPDKNFFSNYLKSSGPQIICLLYVKKNHYMVLTPKQE